ncbi:hypothetical protein [Gemella sp.]
MKRRKKFLVPTAKWQCRILNYEIEYVRYNVRNEDLLLEERRDE